LYRSAAQSHLNLLQVIDGAPAFTDETLLRHVQIEHIERVVDRFDLPHFDEPDFDVLSRCHQDAVTVILSLAQHLHHTQDDFSTSRTL